MGIEKFIKKVCVQDAVYWGNPVNDGRGGMTFDSARQIKCRWEDKQRIRLDDQGREFISVASILVTEDLKIQGYLWLGKLTDIDGYGDSGFIDNDPSVVQGALVILAFDKVPMIKSTTQFVRSVFLGNSPYKV